MNTRDLKYLVAIADHMHFGKAANACFVSQPALSMQIKKLEETLGVKLIERTNKKVIITEIGKQIIAASRNILEQVETLHEIAHNAQDPLSGELRLGIIPTLAPYLLPFIMAELSKTFPRITLYLIEEQTAHLLSKLTEAKLDAILLALPINEHDFVTTPLFTEEFMLAVSPLHPLAKRKTIKLSDLTDKTLLLLEEGHCLRDQALSFCQQINATESRSFQATSLETLRYMVLANAGITLMPKLACKEKDGISYLSFSSSKPQRTIGMVWRNTSTKKLALESIAREIKKILEGRKEVNVI